jgi:hypothetical protein
MVATTLAYEHVRRIGQNVDRAGLGDSDSVVNEGGMAVGTELGLLGGGFRGEVVANGDEMLRGHVRVSALGSWKKEGKGKEQKGKWPLHVDHTAKPPSVQQQTNPIRSISIN